MDKKKFPWTRTIFIHNNSCRTARRSPTPPMWTSRLCSATSMTSLRPSCSSSTHLGSFTPVSHTHIKHPMSEKLIGRSYTVYGTNGRYKPSDISYQCNQFRVYFVFNLLIGRCSNLGTAHSVVEGTAGGTLLLTPTAVDFDLGLNGTVRYTLDEQVAWSRQICTDLCCAVPVPVLCWYWLQAIRGCTQGIY